MEREAIEFDVAIVGAGPAGLTAACRLKQLAMAKGLSLSVCVLEKGSEVGAHIISGALLETSALDELFPDWRERGAPVKTPVSREELSYLPNADRAIQIPQVLIPKPLHNRNNYVVSLASLCRWLAQQAETLGVEIFAGFSAAEVLYDANGKVLGVVTGDMGVAKNGQAKASFQAGIEIRASCTLFAEGCHGHLGKELVQRFELRKNADPQHYGLGIKEIWKIDPAKHQPGRVLHTVGWPLDSATEGGGFLYHMDNNQLALGFILALNYTNPHLSPFEEMQRWKLHPKIKQLLQGGKRIAYGARAVNKGGWQSLPQLSFPGGMLIGCDAGFLNPAKIRGIHTAMKSGMLAAEAFIEAGSDSTTSLQTILDRNLRSSWLYDELYKSRNVAPAITKWGPFFGGAFAWLDQNLMSGKLPFTLRKPIPDSAMLNRARECNKIIYPRPDGDITFDILSSVALSNTHHEADQPSHLLLGDAGIPLSFNLIEYDEPAQRYCPARVYEIVTAADGKRLFQINAQNCVHCKTCDIKDPSQNITWRPPEGGGGPNYSSQM